LKTVDYSQGPVEPRQPMPTALPYVERLVQCEKFVLDRWQFRAPQQAGGDGRCHIITVLEGAMRVDGDPSGSTLRRGQTVLLPAAAGQVSLLPQDETPLVILDAYLP
jgi:mannose-6-phosphate isomerase class I